MSAFGINLPSNEGSDEKTIVKNNPKYGLRKKKTIIKIATNTPR
jgi:hypothetical protein